MAGYDPATCGLRNRCSTTELHRRGGRNWYLTLSNRASGHDGSWFDRGPGSGSARGQAEDVGQRPEPAVGVVLEEVGLVAADAVEGAGGAADGEGGLGAALEE